MAPPTPLVLVDTTELGPSHSYLLVELPPSRGPGPQGLKHRDQTLSRLFPGLRPHLLQRLHRVHPPVFRDYILCAGEQGSPGSQDPQSLRSPPPCPPPPWGRLVPAPSPSALLPFSGRLRWQVFLPHRFGVACKTRASCLLSRPDGRPGRGLAPRGPGGTAWIALLSQLISEGFLKLAWEHGGAACLRSRGQRRGGGAQSSALRQPLLSQVSPVRSSLWGRTRSSSSFRPARGLGEKRCSR